MIETSTSRGGSLVPSLARTPKTVILRAAVVLATAELGTPQNMVLPDCEQTAGQALGAVGTG